jgi:hypothetical protein
MWGAGRRQVASRRRVNVFRTLGGSQSEYYTEREAVASEETSTAAVRDDGATVNWLMLTGV